MPVWRKHADKWQRQYLKLRNCGVSWWQKALCQPRCDQCMFSTMETSTKYEGYKAHRFYPFLMKRNLLSWAGHVPENLLIENSSGQGHTQDFPIVYTLVALFGLTHHFGYMLNWNMVKHQISDTETQILFGNHGGLKWTYQPPKEHHPYEGHGSTNPLIRSCRNPPWWLFQGLYKPTVFMDFLWCDTTIMDLTWFYHVGSICTVFFLGWTNR
jgi:hypothetical protein